MLRRKNVAAGMQWSVVLALALPAIPAVAQDGSRVDADVHKTLDNKKYRDVNAAVHGDMVVLTGTVERYADKEDADRRVHHVGGVKGVDNEIQVAGTGISDEALRDKLAKALSYDRVGYGTTAFNSISIGVQNGVVTLQGTVYGPPDKDSALSLAANYPGVKDVIDNIEVAPPSPMDDRIRIATARAVYGYPSLN